MSTVVLLITIVMVAIITNNVSYCISNTSGNVNNFSSIDNDYNY